MYLIRRRYLYGTSLLFAENNSINSSKADASVLMLSKRSRVDSKLDLTVYN